MKTETAVLAVVIISLITALLRFAPFLIFRKGKTPRVIEYLGKVLPFAVMGMLVVYCLKDVSFASVGGFVPALIAGAVVAGSYIWKRNTLLSILIGTVIYMVLVQAVFV